MLSGYRSQKITRRGMLRAGALLAGMSAIPLLQACSGQPAAAPTTAPAAAPTTAPAAAAPTSAPTAAATTAAAAPTTAATGTTPTAAAAAAGTTPTAAAAANTTPAASTQAVAAIDPKSVKINGKLQILQEKDYNPIHNDNLNKAVKTFAGANNWSLDLSYMDAFVGGGDFYQKMAAAVASDTQPDMMFGTKDAFILSYNKLAQPVDDVVGWAQSVYGDAIPGLKLANVIDGKWYGVPFFTRTGGNFARKSWFDAVGFDITATNVDLQQWLDACLKVSDPSKKHWGWGRTVNKSGDGLSGVREPLFGAGVRYTDETGTKVTFQSDQTVAVFQWLKDTYTGDKYAKARPPGLDGWSDTSNNENWIAGTIGFTNNAGTLFAQSVKQVPDIAKDSFLVPEPKGPIGAKQSNNSAGGATLNLFVGAKNPDAAKAVMENLLSKANQKQMWSTSSGYACPAYKWGWDEPEVTGSVNNVDKIFQEIVYGPQVFQWMPGPGPRLWINAIDNGVVLTNVMAAVIKGTPIPNAVADGQKTIQGYYDQYQGK